MWRGGRAATMALVIHRTCLTNIGAGVLAACALGVAAAPASAAVVLCVAGVHNTAAGDYAALLGSDNSASALASTVSGGRFNAASGAGAAYPDDFVVVSGGMGNRSIGQASVVSAGNSNTAMGIWGAWVGGGYRNLAAGSSAAVSGGAGNHASGANTSVLGGLNEDAGFDGWSQAGATGFTP